METTARSDSTVRFGPFELNLETRELFRDGVRLKIRGQPIEILAILVQHPGNLVTRALLQKQLWPDDTFVDFEHILNNCIGRLRETLSDQADSPKFIETLPRLGYRFIAPVSAQAQNVPEAHQTASAATPEAAAGTETQAPRLVSAPRRRARILVLLTATTIALIGAFAVTRWYLRRNVVPPRIQSIAVLPFENLSGDPSQEYFADGMTEELITELGVFGDFRVISRTSVMRLKGTRKPLPEIARELGVEGIVEGTVARSGDHLHITANFLQAATEKHLWANTYESEIDEVLVVQSKVAHSVAAAIRNELTREAAVQRAPPRRVNPEAYQAYLEGRYYAWRMSLNGYSKADESLWRSVNLDPTFAPAYSSISIFYFAQAINGVRRAGELFPLARMTALKALELDDRLAEAHTALAVVKQAYEWDWAGAEHEHNRAIQLNPSSVDAHVLYATFLTAMGRPDEAIREAREAIRLDPESPYSNVHLGWSLYFAGRHDESIARLKRVLELDPRFAWANMELAWNYAQKGMFPEAIAECKNALRTAPDNQVMLGNCGRVYGQAGMPQAAMAILAQLNSIGRSGYVNPCAMALVYDGMGDTEHAIEWLERAYDERATSLLFLKIEHSPRLHADPRFQALLKKLNFP